MMRRIFLISLIVTLLLLEAAASPGRRTVAVAGGNDSLLQQRRPLDTAEAVARLQRDMGTIVGAAPAGTRLAILVRSLRTGRVLYALNPDTPLTPASTTKVATCFTALSTLGVGYVVKTTLESETKPRNGALPKNLYVKGYGDPSLSVSKLDDLCEQFLRLGTRRIDGDVVGDGTFFDEVNTRFAYSGDRDDPEPVAPIDALTLENRSYTVIVSSTSVAGSPCNVQTWPHSTAFTIVNKATVGPAAAPRRGRHSNVLAPEPNGVQRYGDRWPATQKETAQRTPRRKTTGTAERKTAQQKPGATNTNKKAAPLQLKRSGVKVDVTTESDGRMTITVSGTLPPGRTVSVRQPLRNAPLVIAGVIMERLLREGVAVGGRLTSGPAPAARKVLAETGRPLVDILRTVIKQSHNFLAEYTFRIVGAASGGQQGTAAHAVATVQERMNRCGVPFGNCTLNDGSGLSRRNLLSPAALVGIMGAAWTDKKIGPTFESLLAIAGVDGTLRGRMKGTPAAANLHGKTGTLNNVSTLTGYVTTRDGEPLAFAFMMNGSGGGYRAMQDRLGVRLASFSYNEPSAPPPAAKPATVPKKGR